MGIIGEEIHETSEEIPINGEEKRITSEIIPRMKKAERNARLRF